MKCLDHIKKSFLKKKAAFQSLLVEVEAQPGAALTDMAAFGDHLREKEHLMLSDWSALSVELKTACRQLSAARSYVGTSSGQLTEQKKMKEDAEQKTTDVRYELDGSKAKITQFEGLEGRLQEGVDRIRRWAGRLKAGIDSFRDKLFENL